MLKLNRKDHHVVIIKIDHNQIKKAIRDLPLKERIKLIEDISSEVFPSQFREIISKLRAQTRTHSFRKITRITEKVRQALYAKETKSHH